MSCWPQRIGLRGGGAEKPTHHNRRRVVTSGNTAIVSPPPGRQTRTVSPRRNAGEFLAAADRTERRLAALGRNRSTGGVS
ncbi:MAG: hypothetical protein IAG10_27070 [Planctomycetaceae bacterium]|nr:hypothetical protein [Planctomycetaceae bacterium]